jgi:hypothetical protein
MRKYLFMLGIVMVVLLAFSGQFLLIDRPQKADAIVVLAGETDRRPARGLELLDQGYAPKMMLNVPAAAKVYQLSQPELAQKYIDGLPQARAVSVCPIYGLSTKDEAKDTGLCLRIANVHRVLLVTSDYHTRRTLSVYRHEAPGFDYSVAATQDSREFGAQWWKHREWAKVNFEEWMKLLWWEAVDRWR